MDLSYEAAMRTMLMLLVFVEMQASFSSLKESCADPLTNLRIRDHISPHPILLAHMRTSSNQLFFSIWWFISISSKNSARHKKIRKLRRRGESVIGIREQNQQAWSSWCRSEAAMLDPLKKNAPWRQQACCCSIVLLHHHHHHHHQLSTTTSQALLPAANLSIPEPNSLQQVETILKPKRSAPRKCLHRTEWRTFFTPNTQLCLILATMMVKIA